METKRTSKRKGKTVRVNLTLCRYEVVRRVARNRGWKLVTDENPDAKPTPCNLHWIDVPDIVQTFKGLLPYQKVNHFPGMSNLACKSKLARNLERMKKLFPSEFDFVPRTWILPFDQYEFQQNFNTEGESQRTFIVKPDHMCQGRGVFLTRKLSQIPRGEVMVAQQYVARPLLIDGKKFDLRIYVLITSCSPLRVYIFKDGLVRMCTADYVAPNADNLEQRFMHLTNYAVNKHSNNFEVHKGDDADGKGSKRSVRWFFSWLREIYPDEQVDALWERIGDICLKAILSVQPTLAQEYRSTFAKYLRRNEAGGGKNPRPGSVNDGVDSDGDSMSDVGGDSNSSASTPSSPPSCCFSLLGMDVLVDEQLKPWLLEVNHLPSFGCDSPLDWSVKEPLISQTFDLLNLSPNDKDNYQADQARALQRRLYGGVPSPVVNDNQRGELPPLFTSSPRVRTPEEARPEADTPSTLSLSDSLTKIQLPFTTDQLRVALTAFYSQFCPDRLKHLDKIVSKYADNQEELTRSLQQKYGKNIREFAPRDSLAAESQQQQAESEMARGPGTR
ncbi:hypothetical protein BBO99_00005576 [Phytophthora kernoviae]|uniref:Uncharacterized protein n=2 Tax=Phytophthora kernoviae TaxID=325452 RepID=A0A421F1Y5_9STRA|nr:hypothetical protein G195_008460 [Phytophthora kernoviae 00238/432]KAG2519555.1 hypothetical protein JM16_007108 [Phytophthora kernoviae]KAG2520886.1 hypothetical protein JM18_006898 [Phytophthora kernoviae]RLN15043.1 hypothetical protein BBI17_005449 [Phytophthora kernoviae]RLN79003.1 hypothetical protein BBO99_00005576 [Phytophthora kernoviae]